jgi:hypothetical protein
MYLVLEFDRKYNELDPSGVQVVSTQDEVLLLAGQINPWGDEEVSVDVEFDETESQLCSLYIHSNENKGCYFSAQKIAPEKPVHSPAISQALQHSQPAGVLSYLANTLSIINR